MSPVVGVKGTQTTPRWAARCSLGDLKRARWSTWMTFGEGEASWKLAMTAECPRPVASSATLGWGLPGREAKYARAPVMLWTG